jgi:hypothetical protein
MTEDWTTINVGRDGHVYDLGKGQRAPESKYGKPYHLWFGQACTQAYCDMLMALPNDDARLKQLRKEIGD